MRTYLESNEKIAKYMELEESNRSIIDSDEKFYKWYGTDSILKYHDDWNWIMSVIDKIESESGFSDIMKPFVGDSKLMGTYQCSLGEDVDEESEISKMDAVYKAIIKYLDHVGSRS